MKDGVPPPAAVRRVLVQCPTWLGDTVMALPAIHALHGLFPGAELWCQGPWAPALLGEVPGVARRLSEPAGPAAWLARLRELRAAALDLAVVLPNSFRSGVVAWLSGARWRVGYATDGRGALLTHALASPAGLTHQVTAYLGLPGALGAPGGRTDVPALAVSEERRAEARRLLAEAGVPAGRAVVGLQLGAAMGPAKLWGAGALAALSDALERRGAAPVFLGAPEGAPLFEAVRARARVAPRSLVGRDRPDLLPALLAEVDVLVSSDSGPAHLAAAVGTATVTLFGPTDPRLTAPRGPRQRILWRRPPCAPCFLACCPIDHRCLAGLPWQEVEAAVREALHS